MCNDFISEHKDELGSKASDNQKTIHDLVVLIERLKAIATNLESNKEDSKNDFSLSNNPIRNIYLQLI